MKIKNITISGYRSIKEPIAFEFGNINALIGANNVGKSNILKAIYSVLGKDWVTVNNFDENDVFGRETDQDIEILIEFDQPYKYQQFAGIDPIDIPKISFLYTRYIIGPNKGMRRLEKKCLNSKNGPVQILAKRPQIGEQRQFQPLTTIPQEVQENIPVIYIGTERELKYQLPSYRNSLLGILLENIDKNFQDPQNTISVKDRSGATVVVPRMEQFNKLIKSAISVLRTDDFLGLEKTIKDNVLAQLGIHNPGTDQDCNIYFDPLTSLDFYKSLNLYVEENNFKINATELGGGFQNALVIAILKAFEERKKSGAIFLIEEPEMFLHPQMQRSLYSTLRKIGETNQIIYTTHSPHFVTIPEYDEITLIKKVDGQTNKAKSTLIKTKELEEKFRKELDPERNEMFFAKKILLVEGDTEKLALPEYAKREVLDIDNNGATIIEVGGKRNLLAFADLASSFGIPFGIVYDIDSSDIRDKAEELKFNELLDGYENDKTKVWKLNKNYEEELKSFLTDAVYCKACEKYPNSSKAVKARLIAQDQEYNVPDFVKPIIIWLTSQ